MLTAFKLPEALRWLAEQTGREWTDSELFDACCRYGIKLHAAPPLEARTALVEIDPTNPAAVRVAMRLGWKHAILHPWHVMQLWQVGATEPAPVWQPMGESEAHRWAVFDPEVRVTREHLVIGRETLQRIVKASSKEPAAAPVAAPPANTSGKRWTPEALKELADLRDKKGTKAAALWAGVSTQRVRNLLPKEPAKPKGYSAFNPRP